MHGCFLYMHTPMCYNLSLQLAILLNYKLLKISIIRTKMWSLKIIQYDFKCCAEQLANSICIFLKVLDCCHRSCIPISKPSHNLKYRSEECKQLLNNPTAWPSTKPLCLFTVPLLLLPQTKGEQA